MPMSTRIICLLLSSSLLCGGIGIHSAVAAAPTRNRIELKDGWYYLDGQKFLLNAIGYEPGARPGETPLQNAGDRKLMWREFGLIKAAGFNGIRTWKALPEEELRLVQNSGLKVVFGIWLGPDEDFADPKVIEKDLGIIRQALAYSHKYDCIVTYLIMNEPMPEHLCKVGGQATLNLWRRAVELIHELHPGIPVTISNNADVGEWVDMNVFDVYARNAYDYHDGHNFTHGFANAMRMVTESYRGNKPAILTEFGRSVSRAEWHPFYGGNTLQGQAKALTQYYRDILDSGATGLCPFYFADGWWKGGEPAVHNDAPEEWFGFFGYRNLQDRVGYARPVWHALTRYNRALVVSPKNQQFYQNEVPVEIFAQPDVKMLRIIYLDGILLQGKPDARGHYAGKLSFPGENLKDREFIIEAYDGKGRLLKEESIVVLTGKDPIQWPTLELRCPATTLDNTKELAMAIEVKNTPEFTLGNTLRYSFSAHKGWDSPEDHTAPLDPKQGVQAFSTSYQVPDRSVMLALYAGADIRHGKFTKTIYGQKYLYRGTWADPIRVK